MQTLDLVRGDRLADDPDDAVAVTIITEAWSGHTTGYLARVEVTAQHGCPLYEFERHFAQPVEDLRSDWGNGRRVYRVAEAGVYEAESRWHGGMVRRHWFTFGDAWVARDGCETLIPTLCLLADRDEAMARLWEIPVEDLRQRRLEAWQERPSRQGWKARQEAAAGDNRAAGLAELEGTPGQVAYAEVIRQGRLAEIGRRLGSSERLPWSVSAAAAALQERVDAVWWIENRRRSWRRLLFS